MSLLSRIRVVLVGTQHPGNIGSAARAMKTMGLNNLVLVAPEIFPDPRADALAVGAVDLLEKARICADLDEALAGCTRVAATTARPRHIAAQPYQPREWAQRLAASDMAGDIALMFGRERTGLTNEEIDRAQELIAIPTSADYTSLNMASAVQILCYELLLAAGASPLELPVHEPVDQVEMERFYVHLEQILARTQFIDRTNPRLLMRRLRKLYGRAAPDSNEMNILRGILTSVTDALERERVQASKGQA
ncbi:RNA methyltransferase [Nevskia soli]|uniref:RNA methyltransferase n=1 Tax=Nevskia soli TaxID=418856 RepID=UPI00056682F8|nr:RNA methyltransferase [Nevskia soli]